MAGQGRDYYEILTVPREAARAQIERAYAANRAYAGAMCDRDTPHPRAKVPDISEGMARRPQAEPALPEWVAVREGNATSHRKALRYNGLCKP